MLLSELAIFLVVCVLGCEAGIQAPAHTLDYALQRQIVPFREGPKSQPAGERQEKQAQWQEKQAQIGKQLSKFVKSTKSSINKVAKNMQASKKEQSIVPFEGTMDVPFEWHEYTEFVNNHLHGINFIREKIRDATSYNHKTLKKLSSDVARGHAVNLATRVLNGGVGTLSEQALLDRTCKALIVFGETKLADALIPDQRSIRDYQSLKEICAGALEKMLNQPYSPSEYYVPDPVDHTIVY